MPISASMTTAAAIAVSAALGGLAVGYLLGRRKKPPIKWADKYCERILFSAEDLQAAIASLAAQLNRDYGGKRDSPPLIIGVLSGVYMTLADLTRQLEFEHDVDFIKASSYGTATTPTEVQLATALNFDLVDRDVIVVDELVDSARTLSSICTTLRGKRARSVKTVCVIDKPLCHKVPFRPDYFALECPDVFIFGYGMDCRHRFRSLPFVAVANEGTMVAPDGSSSTTRSTPHLATAGADNVSHRAAGRANEAQELGERLKRMSKYNSAANLDAQRR
jgi:hypoxanthine phosphoribosyltransferase